MDPDQQPQSQAEAEHNFPGSAAEEQQSTGGVLASVADIVEMADIVPLLGTAANLIKFGGDAGAAMGHAANGRDDYNAGNGHAGSEEFQKADEAEGSMVGDLINAIPLVGTARALM
jgi:hypothetical protein